MYDFYWWQNYRRLKNKLCPKCDAKLFRTEDTDVRICLECDYVEPDEVRLQRHRNSGRAA